MVPELVVPDLNGFELKPYVSYRTDVEIEKRYVLDTLDVCYIFFSAVLHITRKWLKREAKKQLT